MNTIKDAGDRSRALVDIADEYAKAGDFDQALKTAEAIDDPDDRFRSQALLNIAGRYIEIKEADKASRLLSQALEKAKEMKDAAKKSSTYAGIAQMHGKLGQIDQASKLLSQALEIAMTIEDMDDKCWELVTIAGMYTEVGQKEQSSHVLSQAQITIAKEEPFVRDFDLEMIATAYAEAGYFIKAIEINRMMEDDEPKSWALNDIACKIAKLSEKDKDILQDITHAMKP